MMKKPTKAEQFLKKSAMPPAKTAKLVKKPATQETKIAKFVKKPAMQEALELTAHAGIRRRPRMRPRMRQRLRSGGGRVRPCESGTFSDPYYPTYKQIIHIIRV
jgi:hypothetical protein